MDGEEKYHQKEFNKMKDANELYSSLSVQENCTSKIQLHDLDIVADSKEDSGKKVKGKTPLDVEKLIATVVKMGYHEQRDDSGNILAFSEEAKDR
jgi:hypothetical protein